MQVNLHSHKKSNNFRIAIHQLPNSVPVMYIWVGEAEVTIFLHDGCEEKALADIDNAIRAFVGSQD